MTQFARSILVSEWASEHKPIVNSHLQEFNQWKNTYENARRTERFYVSLRRKFFCKCGCESKGHLQKVERIPEPKFRYIPISSEEDNRLTPETKKASFNPATDYYHFKPTIVCPECGAAPDVILPWEQINAARFLDYAIIFDNRTRKENNHTIGLGIGTTSYFFNRDVRKIGVKSTRTRLTHNIHTGMTYALKIKGRRSILNVSYGSFPRWMMSDLEVVINKQRKTVEEYARMIFNANVEWLRYEDVIDTESNAYNKLVRAMYFSALPQLQCLPFKSYGFLEAKDRQKIRKIGFNGKKLWELFSGHSSRRFRKIIKTEQDLHLFRQYVGIIEDDNNLYKLFNPELHTERVMWGGHCINGTFASDDGRRGYAQKKQEYRYMMRLHRDEAHFVNTLLKLRQPTFRGGLVDRKAKEHQWSLTHAWHIVSDSVRMVRDILARDQTYQVVYKNDLQEFHDRLARDLNRYRNPYKEIQYSNEEKEVYEQEIQGYKFVLAKSNHELTRVGNEQNICVGGYGDRAIRKDCVIVLVYNQAGEQRLTLDLGRQYDNERAVVIYQAKLARNVRPETEEANIVAEYCYETNTIWDSCHDLSSANCDFPRIPGGVAPTWAPIPREERREHIRLQFDEAYRLMGIENNPEEEAFPVF